VFANKQLLEVHIMKFSTVFVAAALAIPAVSSFAQSSQQPITRAEVKAQQAQLEQAGYSAGADSTTYPAQLQAVEAKLSAHNSQSSYGGVADGSSASGSYRANVGSANGLKPTYFGR
jgi:hypothetical protein